MEKQKTRLELPRSDEVRGWDMLYRAHTGSTSDLVQLACELDLERELSRSKAAEEVGGLLMSRLRLNGYLTIEDIQEILENWHEAELVD